MTEPPEQPSSVPDQPEEPEPPDQSAASSQRRSGRARLAQQRRNARGLALETLYEVDLTRHRPGSVFDQRIAGLELDQEVVSYARLLIDGVLRHRQELDAIIQERASAWPLDQMAAIDRNVLRLGLYECLHQRDTVPLNVVIDQAVELARHYGGESSPRFVNGVLGRAVGSAPGDGTEP